MGGIFRKAKIKHIFNSGHNMNILKFRARRDALIDGAMTKKDSGVGNADVIVSLTSFGKRVLEVAATVESIMEGTVRPGRIILWLDEAFKNKPLPILLQRQMARGLEVEYIRDIRSYTKLIPALHKYPEATIITIDDDALYPYDLVERLLNAHAAHPRDIIACRVHRVRMKGSTPMRYRRWGRVTEPDAVSPLNFLTGVGGVLYPAHCLDPEVLNEEVFMNICKYADDIWFYAMALKAGTMVRKCLTHTDNGDDFITDDDDYAPSLRLLNTKKGVEGNDAQFTAVMNKYNLWSALNE